MVVIIRKIDYLVKVKKMCYYDPMEVSLLDLKSLRIKSKRATFIVDPFEKLPKTPADAVLVLSDDYSTAKVSDFRVVIKSPGDYEVGGVKVSGISLDGSTVFDLNVDGVDVLLAKTSSITKVTDKIDGAEVAIFNADTEINPAVVTALEPRVVVLYGEKAQESVKALGKDDAEKVQKFSAVEGKLPEEMQVILLK